MQVNVVALSLARSHLEIGNQSNVMPVIKPTQRRQPNAALASGSRRSTSIQSLVGWAPGPAGEGRPLKLLPLAISLPRDCTAPEAHDHYESIREKLREHARSGGQENLTIIVNARLTTQERGRVKPTVIMVSGHSIILFKSR